MRNVVFELSLVHDFGFMVENLVVRRVGEEIPIERVGNFVESLRLEILAAAIGVVSHKWSEDRRFVNVYAVGYLKLR
jgi:hypothetical protein